MPSTELANPLFFGSDFYVLSTIRRAENNMESTVSNYYYLYTESKIPSGLSQLLHYVLLQPEVDLRAAEKEDLPSVHGSEPRCKQNV